MSKWGWLIRAGGIAGAPFTGGLSLPAGLAAASAVEHKQHANDAPQAAGGIDPKHPEAGYLNILQQNSQQAQKQGEQFTGEGMAALAPVLSYYRDLLGSNPAALSDAMRPEVGRVIDQYDSARRTAEQFSPRGGGTTSALAQSRFNQAESLADITSQSRRSAAASMGQMGVQLTGLGLTSQDMATRSIEDIIQAVLAREGLNVQQRGQNMQMWGDVAETAGTLLGIWLGRDKAA